MVGYAAMQKKRHTSFLARVSSVLKQMSWSDCAQNHKYSKKLTSMDDCCFC